MVSIADRRENLKLHTILDRIGLDETVWIGASDRQGEGYFTWVDNTELAFTDWYVNEPNNHEGHEDCVHLHDKSKGRKWNDLSCSARMAFACKVPTYFT